VVDPKRITGKKWRAEEEERHKGLLTKKNLQVLNLPQIEIDLKEPTSALKCYLDEQVRLYITMQSPLFKRIMEAG
jgi:hypothetical protein